MDHILMIIGLTLLVFGIALNLFLYADYSRRLLFELEQEQKAKLEAGDAAGSQAVEEEIILLQFLAPRYARWFVKGGVVLLAVYFIISFMNS